MKFRKLSVSGVWVVEIEPAPDERGFFARTVCAEEFKKHGLPGHYCQSSISFNPRRGTLRGMHYQTLPSFEQKLVRCTRGAMFDVIVDLRPDSETFGRWDSVELSADNHRAVAVPAGCAHGFITLSDETEVLYMMSEPLNAGLARGVRWDDPAFGIAWPERPVVISERDAAYPDYNVTPQKG
jgi:dTDP-4-dehydrorhamnose 3,5-epimerase